MRKLLIRPEAEADLADAFDWYEARVPGLGAEFLTMMDRALERIAGSPHNFPVVHKNLRRALPSRFPYQIFFIVEEHRVVVLAVLHAKRNPKQWIERNR